MNKKQEEALPTWFTSHIKELCDRAGYEESVDTVPVSKVLTVA